MTTFEPAPDPNDPGPGGPPPNPLRPVENNTPKKNTFAMPGMIVGIVAAGLSILPFISLIAIVPALVALAFGGIALHASLTNDAPGRGAAITAISTGGFAVILWMLWFFFWASF